MSAGGELATTVVESRQKLLAKRRAAFVERCMTDLVHSFRRHRFLGESFRNPFEVHRLWMQETEVLLTRAQGDLALSLCVLMPQALSLHRRAASLIADGDRDILDNLVRELRQAADLELSKKLELSRAAAVGRRDRDMDYFGLMLEMIDRAEELARAEREP